MKSVYLGNMTRAQVVDGKVTITKEKAMIGPIAEMTLDVGEIVRLMKFLVQIGCVSMEDFSDVC